MLLNLAGGMANVTVIINHLTLLGGGSSLPPLRQLAPLWRRRRGVQQGSQEDVLRLVTADPRSTLSLCCPPPMPAPAPRLGCGYMKSPSCPSPHSHSFYTPPPHLENPERVYYLGFGARHSQVGISWLPHLLAEKLDKSFNLLELPFALL